MELRAVQHTMNNQIYIYIYSFMKTLPAISRHKNNKRQLLTFHLLGQWQFSMFSQPLCCMNIRLVKNYMEFAACEQAHFCEFGGNFFEPSRRLGISKQDLLNRLGTISVVRIVHRICFYTPLLNLSGCRIHPGGLSLQ